MVGGRFTPRKEIRYPFYRRLSEPQGRSERVRKISPSPEFDPRTVQPVASHYTDWAIPAHNVNSVYNFIDRLRMSMRARVLVGGKQPRMRVSGRQAI